MDLPVVIDGHHPDDCLGLAVPSHHHHPDTDAAGSLASLSVDQPSPSSSSSLRSATKSMRASITVPYQPGYAS